MKAKDVLWNGGWYAFGVFASSSIGCYVSFVRGDPGSRLGPVLDVWAIPFFTALLGILFCIPFTVWLALRSRRRVEHVSRRFYMPFTAGLLTIFIVFGVIMFAKSYVLVDALGEAGNFLMFFLLWCPAVALAEICVQIAGRLPSNPGPQTESQTKLPTPDT